MLMRTWLKLLGSPDRGMAETIVPQVLRLVRFPRRPSIRVGDKIVLYVLTCDHIFGIVEAWFLDVREVIVLPYSESPSLYAVSVGGRNLRKSVSQQSHIQLRDLEYRRAVELLSRAEP